MKKILSIIFLALMLVAPITSVYAGGDQNQENHCADKSEGPAGDTAGGDASRNRAAAD